MKKFWYSLLSGALSLVSLVILWCVDWRIGIAYVLSLTSSFIDLKHDVPEAADAFKEACKRLRE